MLMCPNQVSHFGATEVKMKSVIVKLKAVYANLVRFSYDVVDRRKSSHLLVNTFSSIMSATKIEAIVEVTW